MKAKVQVLAVQSNKGKNGNMYYKLCCLDMEPAPARMMDTFDFNMNPYDIERIGKPDTLTNEIIEIGLTGLRAGFGGRFEYSGIIISELKKPAGK